MENQNLIDAVARIIEPQLFAMPSEGQDPAYYRFVENTKARASEIIILINALAERE